MNRGTFGLKNALATGVLAASALLGTPGTSDAGFDRVGPDMFMSVELRDTSHTPLFVSGEVNLSSIGSGNMVGGFTYFNPQQNYPALQDSRYNSTGFVLARTQSGPGGVPPGTLFINMQFENKTANTLEYIINYRMPVTAPTTGPYVDWTSDSVWNSVGPNNATVQTLPGMSLFTAYIDGAVVGTQFDPPSGASGIGWTINGDDLSGITPDVTQDLRIRLAFSLTPGAQVGIQGNVTIPAPGAAALLAAAGLVTQRRRRR
jgi:hypothetical protein